MISLCGDNCLCCPRYLAKTEEELHKVAELWYRLGMRDRVVSPWEMACSGCSSHKLCSYELVDCTESHSVGKCNQCSEFPCDKISAVLKKSKIYEDRARQLCTSEELALLSAAFFEKEKNLRK